MGDVLSFPTAPVETAPEGRRQQDGSGLADQVNPALAGMLHMSVDLLEKLVAELRAALEAVPLGPDQRRFDQDCRAMLAAIEAAKARLEETAPSGTVSRAGSPPA